MFFNCVLKKVPSHFQNNKKAGGYKGSLGVTLQFYEYLYSNNYDIHINR